MYRSRRGLNGAFEAYGRSFELSEWSRVILFPRRHGCYCSAGQPSSSQSASPQNLIALVRGSYLGLVRLQVLGPNRGVSHHQDEGDKPLTWELAIALHAIFVDLTRSHDCRQPRLYL